MAGEAVSIRVEGIDRLSSTLRALKSDLAEIAPPDAGRVIGTAAQQRAPKRTGRLAASMSSEADSGVVSVTFGAAHAGPLNFGVGPRSGMRGPHNIRATRFLTGTVADREAVWMNAYEKSAQDAVDRVKGA